MFVVKSILNKIIKLSESFGPNSDTNDLSIGPQSVQPNNSSVVPSSQKNMFDPSIGLAIQEKAKIISNNWEDEWSNMNINEVVDALRDKLPELFSVSTTEDMIRKAVAIAEKENNKVWTEKEIDQWVKENGVNAPPPPSMLGSTQGLQWYQQALERYSVQQQETNEIASSNGIPGKELGRLFINTWISSGDENDDYFRNNISDKYNNASEYFSKTFERLPGDRDWIGLIEDHAFKEVAGGAQGNNVDGRLAFFFPPKGESRDIVRGLRDELLSNPEVNVDEDMWEVANGKLGIKGRSKFLQYMYENYMDIITNKLEELIINKNPLVFYYVVSRVSSYGMSEDMRTQNEQVNDEGKTREEDSNNIINRLLNENLTEEEKMERVNAQKGVLSDMMKTLSDFSEEVHAYLNKKMLYLESQGKLTGNKREAYEKNIKLIKMIAGLASKTIEKAFSDEARIKKLEKKMGFKFITETGQIIPTNTGAGDPWGNIQWSKIVSPKALFEEALKEDEKSDRHGKGRRFTERMDLQNRQKEEKLLYMQTGLLLDKIGDYLVEDLSEKYPPNVILAFLDIIKMHSNVTKYGKYISEDIGKDNRKSYLKDLFFIDPNHFENRRIHNIDIGRTKSNLTEEQARMFDIQLQKLQNTLADMFSSDISRVNSENETTMDKEMNMDKSISDNIQQMRDKDVLDMVYPFLLEMKRRAYKSAGSSTIAYKRIREVSSSKDDEGFDIPGELWKKPKMYTPEEKERANMWNKSYGFLGSPKQSSEYEEEDYRYAASEQLYFIVKNAISSIGKLKNISKSINKYASSSHINDMIDNIKRNTIRDMNVIGNILND